MNRRQTRRKAEKVSTFLGSRFRFHAVAALLRQQFERQEPRPLRIKLAFDDRRPETPYCPFCRDSELRVYRRALGDEWGCCPECGFATDPVGLIMVELRCTDREAVEYLVFQHNLHRVPKTEIDEYLFHRAQYERYADLLQERLHVDYSLRQHCPEHGLNPNSLQHLLDTLDLRQSLGGKPEIEMFLNRMQRFSFTIRSIRIRKTRNAATRISNDSDRLGPPLKECRRTLCLGRLTLIDITKIRRRN